MRPAYHVTALCLAGLTLLTTGFVLGQPSAPTDYQSVTEDVLATIDLAHETDSLASRELRLSRASIAPGGHIGLHSHRGDPTIVYVLSGVLTNHHDDGTTQEFHSGEVFTEFGPRAHWIENRGAGPVIYIAANI
ncbi:MAG: cupin domain-containing protein, partial [Alphaproteobacteria bacterium]|nr:cupin domain-containing protein [Alphaproteobacteria bacterium]